MSSFEFNMKALLLAGLTAEDSADLANFNCGDDELNRFLQEEALNEQEQKLQEGTIHITRTVAGKGYNPPKSKNGIREVPLDRSTLQILMRHRVQQNKEKLLHGGDYNSENLVFCSQQNKGKRLSYRMALDAYGRIVKMSGLPYYPTF